MRLIFSLIFSVLAVASVIAWKISPRTAQHGKMVLVWATDDNPARREQAALFNKLYPQYDLQLDLGDTGIEKVLVQSSSGVGPDLFDAYTPGQLQRCVASGVAWDITEEMTQRGIRTELTWPLAW